MLDFYTDSEHLSTENAERELVTVWIERKTMPNGCECCTLIRETGELFGTMWTEAPKKQRKGKRSRYSIGFYFDDLTDKQKLALLGIRTLIMVDGKIKSRRRNRQARKAELVDELGTPGMLRALMEADVIYEKDGWFYVDRRFLFRG